MSSAPLVVSIPGLQLENEKSRRDAHPALKNAHVQAIRTAANEPVCRALQALGCYLKISWTSKDGRLVRFTAEGWERLLPRELGAPPYAVLGPRALLERLGPVPLVDWTESLSSAHSAVRDGVGEALGLGDAELLPAWGADGEGVYKPGAIRWAYEQRRGGARGAPDEWGVRITIGV